MSEINEYVAQAVDDSDEYPEVPAEFSIHDDSSANWLIRKILECRAYAKRCSEWCEREQARAKRDEEFFQFRYGRQLEDYARQRIEALGGRRKSISLPAGTFGFRTILPVMVIDDESSVLAWAKEHAPSLVTTVERLSKSELNTHFKQTGELPDRGVRIENEHEKFYVR